MLEGFKTLISVLFEQKALSPSTWPADLLASPTQSGVSVGPETALTATPVASAVQLISGAIACLPFHIYEHSEAGGKIPAIDRPDYDLVNALPNDWTSSAEFRTQLAVDACLHGNAFAAINRLSNGEPFELIYLRPGSTVVLYEPATNEPFYRWNPAPGSSTLGVNAQVQPAQQAEAQDFSWRDIIHIRAPLSVNGGITSVAPIDLCREAIGLTITLEQYAGRLFGNGAKPSGILSTDKNIDAATTAKILAAFNAQHGGANSGKTALLGGGTKYQQISLTSADAQFHEMRVFQLNEIARAFRVPPQMIGEMGRATWSNSEQMAREFLAYCLLPWLRKFEDAYSRAFIPREDRRRYSIEFDVSELVQGDAQHMAEFIGKLRAAGVMTANDARKIISLPKHAEGDILANPFTSTNEPRS